MSLRYTISKLLSRISLLGILGLTVAVITFLLISSLARGGFGEFFADMISSTGFRAAVYETGEKNNDWVSALAYAIGTIVFGGFIIAIITNFFRTAGDRYINGTLGKYRWRGHVVFLGFDELIIGTFKNVVSNNPKERIIVAVPDNVAATRTRLQGLVGKKIQKQVEVVQCNYLNCNDLKKRACVKDAKQVFIIGQPDDSTHDASNLKCLALVAALCGSPNRRPCMYYIRNQATFFLLQRQEIKAVEFENEIRAAGFDFDNEKINEYIVASEPFNVFESIARHLMTGVPNRKNVMDLGGSKKQQPHLVIIGMTPMGTALARMAMMTAHYPGKTLLITMVDEDAYNEMLFFKGRHRYFFEHCKYSFTSYQDHSQDFLHEAKLDFLDVEVEFIQTNISHPELSQYLIECMEPSKEQALNIAVCTNDSPKNMAWALYLPRQILESRVPVWVYQNGDNSMNSFLRHNLYENVRVFSPTEFAMEDRQTSIEWQLAKAVSAGYDCRHGSKVTPWNKLQPKNRWSSLYGAISKIYMFRCAGKTTTPIQLSDEEKTKIAIAEHARWNTEKLLNGFVPTSKEQHDFISRNPYGDVLKKNFVHDDIRPFEELDEKTQKKDFEQIDDVVNAYNAMYQNETSLQ